MERRVQIVEEDEDGEGEEDEGEFPPGRRGQPRVRHSNSVGVGAQCAYALGLVLSKTGCVGLEVRIASTSLEGGRIAWPYAFFDAMLRAK